MYNGNIETEMTETELYKELGTLTKHKDQWETNIPYVLSLLNSAFSTETSPS